MRVPAWPRATVLAALFLVCSGHAVAARQPRAVLPVDASQADQEPAGAPIYFRGALIGRVMVGNGSWVYPWPVWVAGPSGVALLSVTVGVQEIRRNRRKR